MTQIILHNHHPIRTGKNNIKSISRFNRIDKVVFKAGYKWTVISVKVLLLSKAVWNKNHKMTWMIQLATKTHYTPCTTKIPLYIEMITLLIMMIVSIKILSNQNQRIDLKLLIQEKLKTIFFKRSVLTT